MTEDVIQHWVSFQTRDRKKREKKKNLNPNKTSKHQTNTKIKVLLYNNLGQFGLALSKAVCSPCFSETLRTQLIYFIVWPQS